MQLPKHAAAFITSCLTSCHLLFLPPFQAALGPGGVVEGLSAGKGYVDMSTVDEATSTEIAAAVTAKGGRFLEVGWMWMGGRVGGWVGRVWRWFFWVGAD